MKELRIENVYQNYAQLLYKECMRWVLGYIDGKFSFRVMLTNFDSLYRKLQNDDDFEIDKVLSDDKKYKLFEMQLAIEKRIEAIYHDDAYYPEEKLRKKLKELHIQTNENS